MNIDQLRSVMFEGIKSGAGWLLFWERFNNELKKLVGESFMEIQMIDWDGTKLSEVVQLPFMPSSLEDQVSVNWEVKSVAGLNHGLVSWTGSEGKQFSFEFKLVQERREDNNISRYNVPIKDMVQYLRLFTIPRYKDNGRGVKVSFPPPQIILRIPNVPINENGNDILRGVVTGLNISYERLWADGIPKVANINLEIQQVQQHEGKVDIVSWDSVHSDEVLYNIGTNFRFDDVK